MVMILFGVLLSVFTLLFLAKKYPQQCFRALEKLTNKTEYYQSAGFGHIVEANGEYRFTRDDFFHHASSEKIYPVFCGMFRVVVDASSEFGLKIDFFVSHDLDIESLKKSLVKHGENFFTNEYSVSNYLLPKLKSEIGNIISSNNSQNLSRQLQSIELDGFKINRVDVTHISHS